MLIQVLQHVPFERPAAFGDWAAARGHSLSVSSLWRGTLPREETVADWLVVLGGPMGVHDCDRFPWLTSEKRFIQKALESESVVVGICLGAQLVADVLGARIRRNEHVEIGWFPVQREPGYDASQMAGVLPEAFGAFHWHSDTFSIPSGARRIARSAACGNQAFVYAGRVMALQFHLEMTLPSALELIAHCSGDLGEGGPFIQRSEAMVSDPRRFAVANALLFKILDHLEETAGSGPRGRGRASEPRATTGRETGQPT